MRAQPAKNHMEGWQDRTFRHHDGAGRPSAKASSKFGGGSDAIYKTSLCGHGQNPQDLRV